MKLLFDANLSPKLAGRLQGIVKSGRLWATHIYYLNDTQEFKYATGVINDLFQRRIDQSSGVIAERLVQLHNSYKTHVSIWHSLADAYVLCFCAEGNLLSQWRAYAANGEGFAIEFEPESLMEALKRDPDVALMQKSSKSSTNGNHKSNSLNWL